jgi:hypothetical protein
MKTIAIAVLGLFILWTDSALAQSVAASRIQWQKIYGGDSRDEQPCLARTADGGFILGGHSESGVSGNKGTTNYGAYDFWVLRLDPQGNEIWEADFGTEDSEELWAIQPTLDGGFALMGDRFQFQSGSGTPWYSDPDYWLVRLDTNGQRLWDKRFGGVWANFGRTVLQTSDRGFLIAGYSYSPPSGDKTAPNFGSGDFWVIRLDAQGNKLWDKTFGGSDSEYLAAGCKTLDGGFLLAGRSMSGRSGNKASDNYGDYDLWLVRIDADGNLLWERSYGGSAYDEATQVLPLPEGGFVVAGMTTSEVSGNKETPYYGGPSTGAFYGDYWLLRLDSEGRKIWERDFGGSSADMPGDLHQTAEGGFVLTGSSLSPADGNKTAPRLGGLDLWVVRLDAAGERIWDQTYNGVGQLAWPHTVGTSDGGTLIAASVDRGGPGPYSPDLILFKLGADALTAPQLRALGLSANEFRLQVSGISNRTYVTEVSVDLQNWSPLSTNELSSGSTEILDGTSTFSRRFYRARMVE